jgi:mono/diheme cytochrome c family protein
MKPSLYSSFVAALLLVALVGYRLPAEERTWWKPGSGQTLAATVSYADASGTLGILNADGAVDTKGHPFFEPLGQNGRACVTCHQPASGMSLSLDAIRQQWQMTGGRDPLFAAVDGSNCPSLPQSEASSHSLLLNRGLIRIPLPWPPVAHDGSRITPEFTIEVVRDPSTCNTDPVYGLRSATPTVSVFRRPRVAANLKYVATNAPPFNIKTGELLDVDPETGKPVGMNLMSDAREPTLRTQARAAARDHLQLTRPLTDNELSRIVEFESQIYSAQSSSRTGGSLVQPGGPDGLGPQALEEGTRGLGDNIFTPVFGFFEPWKGEAASASGESEQQAFRESVARGADVFLLRPFWIRDATHINSIGLGNPLKRTCATCHNARLVGQDLAPGYVDLGTNNYPRWTEPSMSLSTTPGELPVFKLTCRSDAPPHPFLGRVVYTTDPGRALISGRCADIGAIVMQQMRGLAARAPYFANGGAKTLRELVDYYDRRFDAKYTEREKQDLVNFLSVL